MWPNLIESFKESNKNSNTYVRLLVYQRLFLVPSKTRFTDQETETQRKKVKPKGEKC